MVQREAVHGGEALKYVEVIIVADGPRRRASYLPEDCILSIKLLSFFMNSRGGS
jgi:hypothetical protein